MTELNLNREIYSEKAIDEAIEAYMDYFSAERETTEKYEIIRMLNCKYDVTRTMKEFENYLIARENR